jgi:hypothetical protein
MIIKATMLAVTFGATMLLAGCTSSHYASCSKCAQTGGRSAIYDPTNGWTTISNQGYTWRLKGNQTNMMIYPKD